MGLPDLPPDQLEAVDEAAEGEEVTRLVGMEGCWLRKTILRLVPSSSIPGSSRTGGSGKRHGRGGPDQCVKSCAAAHLGPKPL